MIAECAADLLAKVRTVPALAGSASLSIGGKSSDPGLVKIPLPAAWVTLKTEISDEQSYEHGPSSGHVGPALMMATFCVTVFIPYLDDDDLLTVQFPLLQDIILAVHSTGTPAGALQWRYTGQRIALVYPDRLAYEQRYTVSLIHQ